MSPPPSMPPTFFGAVGRYAIYDELASGGMATVHLGRLRGAAGFSRIVAVKRLHSRFAQDRDFVAMFTDEARIASRIRHPSVVPTLDVVAQDGELFLVMEYVHGETLAALISSARRRDEPVPPPIAATILLDALRGLHEAHEARDERGRPLGVVHRDISPQNLLVGADGVTRVLDFGIAKAAGQLHITSSGSLKGKLGYMPPEQILGEPLDVRADLYALGVVLWEALTARRLFPGRDDVVERLSLEDIRPPSSHTEEIPPALDRLVLRAVQADKGRRFSSAADMARVLEASIESAGHARVGAWVRDLASEQLEARWRLLARIEAAGEETNAPASSQTRLPVLSLPASGLALDPEQLPTPTDPENHADSAPPARSSLPSLGRSSRLPPPSPPQPEPPQPDEIELTDPTLVEPLPAHLRAPPSNPPAPAARSFASASPAALAPTPAAPTPASVPPPPRPPPATPVAIDSAGFSVVEVTPTPAAPRHRAPMLAGAALLAACLLVGWRMSATPAPATTSPASEPPSAPTAPQPSPPAPTEPASEAARPAAPSPSPTPAPAASATGTARRSTPPASAPAPTATSKTAAGCDPPYVLENGVKRYKRACFR